MGQEPPDHPAGSFVPDPSCDPIDPAVRIARLDSLRSAPTQLRTAVQGLNDKELETRYRNWTIRQIVHHVADSHVHSYIRFKWALTEDNPTIKAYEEADWVELDDCRQGDIAPPLALLAGLHLKWSQTIESMSDAQFQRTFVHPQTGECVSLWSALHYYAWHAKHHTSQILWLREHAM